MKDHNIDDLLQVVSPGLIAGYEKNNNVKLTETNEKYKKVCDKDPYAIITKWSRILVVVAVIALVICLIINFRYKQPVLGDVVMVALSVPFILYFKFVIGKRIAKINETISRCEPILVNFRTAVAKLNPLGRIHEYTEERVRDELVSCAVRILDAEGKFDAVRVLKERRFFDIMHYGNFLEKCYKDSDEACTQAIQFGMKFSVDELFADAKKHIEKMNELLRKHN